MSEGEGTSVLLYFVLLAGSHVVKLAWDALCKRGWFWPYDSHVSATTCHTIMPFWVFLLGAVFGETLLLVVFLHWIRCSSHRESDRSRETYQLLDLSQTWVRESNCQPVSAPMRVQELDGHHYNPCVFVSLQLSGVIWGWIPSKNLRMSVFSYFKQNKV